jgi:hypothetical protein
MIMMLMIDDQGKGDDENYNDDEHDNDVVYSITIMRRMMRCDDNDAADDQGKG